MTTGQATKTSKLKISVVLLTLLLGSCMANNYLMLCNFHSSRPLKWYVVRTIWFNKQELGIPLGSSDETIAAWIKDHPDCCAAIPTERHPIKRALFGSNIEVQIAYQKASPRRESHPYQTIEYILTPCGSFVERSGRSELRSPPNKFGWSNTEIESWRVRE
mgnify:FL=1